MTVRTDLTVPILESSADIGAQAPEKKRKKRNNKRR
jgi:hypothetical protein